MIQRLTLLLFILAIIILVLRFFLYGRTDDYRAATSNPQLIFTQACSGCPGEKGEGRGFLYPALHDSTLTQEQIVEAVREGKMIMPAFPMIQDTSLRKLTRYLLEEKSRSR